MLPRSGTRIAFVVSSLHGGGAEAVGIAWMNWFAEAGYDVAALKKRGRGRPGRGAEPSQVIALRLTADEVSALDARAEREGKSRSEVIREALASA